MPAAETRGIVSEGVAFTRAFMAVRIRQRPAAAAASRPAAPAAFVAGWGGRAIWVRPILAFLRVCLRSTRQRKPRSAFGIARKGLRGERYVDKVFWGHPNMAGESTSSGSNFESPERTQRRSQVGAGVVRNMRPRRRGRTGPFTWQHVLQPRMRLSSDATRSLPRLRPPNLAAFMGFDRTVSEDT
jgi:hypothetical protein